MRALLQLRFCATKDLLKAGWVKTANFLAIVRTWWNILNVKHVLPILLGWSQSVPLQHLLRFMYIEENKETAGKDDLSQRFLTQVSREGLMHPSENVFLLCIMAEKVRESIFSESKKLFLSYCMQKDVFTSILSVFNSIGTFPHICKNGYPLQVFWKMAGAAYVNCFMKNFTSETNDFLYTGRKRC